MAGGQQHWDDVYGARTEDALTWFEATPTVSLDLVVSRMLWKFPGGMLRACEGSVSQAARSRDVGTRG